MNTLKSIKSYRQKGRESEIVKERMMIDEARKYVTKKIKKFQKKAMKYIYVKNQLSNDVKRVIGGISLPELSSQYVL